MTLEKRRLSELAAQALAAHREDCDYCDHGAHCVEAFAYKKAIAWLQDAELTAKMRSERVKA